MNYSPTALKMPWYLALNKAYVPEIGTFNETPDQKTRFGTFEKSIDSIGDMLKLGKAKSFISDERIQDVINIDVHSHNGMELLADVITNDFWQGYSTHLNTMRGAIEQRYLSEMPDELKARFIEISNNHLSFQKLSIGMCEADTYTEKFKITITPSEIFLTDFDLGKYKFDSRIESALFSLINLTMRHQLECAAAAHGEYEWLMEETLDGNDEIANKIYQYWQQHNEDFELDIEEMGKELGIESYVEGIEEIGIEPIISYVASMKLELKITRSMEDESAKQCLSALAHAGKEDKNIAFLHKMACYLPNKPVHHALENVGDISMEYQALYTFGSQLEYSLVESIFEQTYQTGEEAALMLEATELGLSFLQNYFESLYLKSLIQAVLE